MPTVEIAAPKVTAMPLPSASPETRHVEFIDSLRGLAILGVMGFHSVFSLAAPAGRFTGVLGHGWLGVQLFFVASALTLCMSANARAAQEDAPWRNFFVRRFFRIAPLYYFGIVLYGIYDYTECVFHLPRSEQASGWLANLFLVHGWIPRWFNNIVPGGWSIGVEFSFYMLFPLLFLGLRQSLLRAWLGLGLFVALGLALDRALSLVAGPANPESAFIRQWLPTQLVVFACGLLLFQVIRHAEAERAKLSAGWTKLFSLAALGAAAALFLLGNQLLDLAHPVFYFLLYGLSFACLGLGLWLRPWRLIVNPLTVGIGQLSYALYLTHWLSLYLVLPRYEAWAAPLVRALPMGRDLLHYGGFLLVTVVSAAFAALCHFAIERPGIKLGRQVIQRLRALSASPLRAA